MLATTSVFTYILVFYCVNIPFRNRSSSGVILFSVSNIVIKTFKIVLLYLKLGKPYHPSRKPAACCRQLPKLSSQLRHAVGNRRNRLAPMHGASGNCRNRLALMHGASGNCRNRLALMHGASGNCRNLPAVVGR